MCVSNYTRCFIGKLFFMSLANLEIFFQTNNTLAGHCSVGYEKRLPAKGSLFLFLFVRIYASVVGSTSLNASRILSHTPLAMLRSIVRIIELIAFADEPP